MKNYARIQDGLVAELLTTDGDILAMFHPALVWVEIPADSDIAEGWSFDGPNFVPPPASPVAASRPTVAELQARIAALAAQIAALSGHS